MFLLGLMLVWFCNLKFCLFLCFGGRHIRERVKIPVMILINQEKRDQPPALDLSALPNFVS